MLGSAFLGSPMVFGASRDDTRCRKSRSSGQEPASLSFAVISVENLAQSLNFYCDLIGFDVVAQGRAGPGLTDLLELPQGTVVDTALLSASGCDVGRILLWIAKSMSRIGQAAG